MRSLSCAKLLWDSCRRRWNRRNSFCCRCCLLFAVIVIVLQVHFFILPASMGYYNDPCYLSSEETDDIRFLIKAIVEVFELYNQTYWLDFGTLLGAVRNGDVLPHDGDIDICRMISSETTSMSEGEFGANLIKFFNQRNIQGNGMVARYKSAKADLCRFKFSQKDGTNILQQYYPSRVTDQLKERILAQLSGLEVAQDLILPTKTMRFADFQVRVPGRPMELLKVRYPFSWWFSMPYKWRCFLP